MYWALINHSRHLLICTHLFCTFVCKYSLDFMSSSFYLYYMYSTLTRLQITCTTKYNSRWTIPIIQHIHTLQHLLTRINGRLQVFAAIYYNKSQVIYYSKDFKLCSTKKTSYQSKELPRHQRWRLPLSFSLDPWLKNLSLLKPYILCTLGNFSFLQQS